MPATFSEDIQLSILIGKPMRRKEILQAFPITGDLKPESNDTHILR